MNGWPKDCLVRPHFFFFYLLTQSLGGPDVVGGARVEAQEALQSPGSVNRCIRVVTEHVVGLSSKSDNVSLFICIHVCHPVFRLHQLYAHSMFL